MSSETISRRNFFEGSAAVAAVIVTTSKTFGATSAVVGPNVRMRIAFIGVGGRAQAHISSAIRLVKEGVPLEVAAVCDVFNRYRDASAERFHRKIKRAPKKIADYRDIIDDPSIDAVVISTPDQWHATQTIAALKSGKNVDCEKPMTHSVEEALAVLKAWKDSGQVMQVGVQSTELPEWPDVNKRICEGQLGKVLQYQTEFFRNSVMGPWRYYPPTNCLGRVDRRSAITLRKIAQSDFGSSVASNSANMRQFALSA